MPDSLLNTALLQLGRDAWAEKQSFVLGNDPGMTGGGGMPPVGDSMAAGAPLPPVGDPVAGGGMPDIQGMINTAVQQAMQPMLAQMGGGAGGAGAGAGPLLKPKIDVNVEIMQIKHMLAKVIDAMGIKISASEMTATPEKLMAMAQGGGPGAEAQGSAPPGGAIPPIEGIQPSGQPVGGGQKTGSAAGSGFDERGLDQMISRVSAVSRIRRGSAA